MKILSVEQIKAFDQYTIQEEPISSIDLMERASLVFCKWFATNFTNKDVPILIFCGTGNNGGDGLAVARLLYQQFYPVQIIQCLISDQRSTDNEINLNRLPKDQAIPVFTLKIGSELPTIPKNAILIDAIFGSGLNRPVLGYWEDLFKKLNETTNTIIAIDIPSGVFADRSTEAISIHAHYTFSFELPKLAFLFPENHQRIGKWNFASIGLHSCYLQEVKTKNYYIDKTLLFSLYKPRNKFDHKGTFGHALLVVGSYGMIGAAILATKACLKIGAGLVTVHLPSCGYEIMQISIPEAMVSLDAEEKVFSTSPDLIKYNSIGIGCGLGQSEKSQKGLLEIIKASPTPLILDADALNILAKHPDSLEQLPANSILTPHPKEFERLFGKTKNNFERNILQRKKAQELNVIILLKGAHTCIAMPSGDCFFNSTGDPGMATAGSGDVLTGILTGLVAQGYESSTACLLGVWLHGQAGSIAAKAQSSETIIASDITNALGKAFQELKK